MSRSFKKTPGSGDTSNSFMKRYFNRKIRQTPIDDETTLQYGKYKKCFVLSAIKRVCKFKRLFCELPRQCVW